MIFTVIINIIEWLIIIVCLLISVAYLTLIERKVLGVMQRRKGPTTVGILGLLQPFADGFKLIIKEGIIPNMSSSFLFFISPIIFFFLSLLIWSLIPLNFSYVVLDLNLSIIYLLAITSLSVYGIIISGWSSNSKYSFLGSLRSSAQMISYEVSIGFILLPPAIFTASFNLIDWLNHQDFIFFLIPFHPLFLMFIISNLAETNRPPFDLPEAESELVAGYSTEFSSVGFVLFFIAEYGNIIFLSLLTSIIFLPNIFSFAAIIFNFIWVRVALPRYRFDQLLRLGWKVLLPLSLAFLSLYSSYFIFAMYNF